MLKNLMLPFVVCDPTEPAGGEPVVVTPVVDDDDFGIVSDEPAEPVVVDKKQESRTAYEARKARERVEKVEKELAEYKRRDKEAADAKKSSEQRSQEELQTLRDENERLKRDQMVNEIAAEFKLPKAMANRIIGSDEESMRADAEALSKLVVRTRVGSATDPVRDQDKPVTYTRAQLRNDPRLAASIAQDVWAGRVQIVG